MSVVSGIVQRISDVMAGQGRITHGALWHLPATNYWQHLRLWPWTLRVERSTISQAHGGIISRDHRTQARSETTARHHRRETQASVRASRAVQMPEHCRGGAMGVRHTVLGRPGVARERKEGVARPCC